jgi:hypothetical protein
LLADQHGAPSDTAMMLDRLENGVRVLRRIVTAR